MRSAWQICVTHVVPHFGYVTTKTSVGRGLNERPTFTLSGEWQGFTWHAPMHTDRCYESSVQAMDMDLVFSAGNDIPAPHHAISGSGSDHIGNWELHSGRSYFRKPHSRKLYGRSAHTLFSTPLRARFGFFDQLASPRLATPRHASPRLATPRHASPRLAPLVSMAC